MAKTEKNELGEVILPDPPHRTDYSEGGTDGWHARIEEGEAPVAVAPDEQSTMPNPEKLAKLLPPPKAAKD